MSRHETEIATPPNDPFEEVLDTRDHVGHLIDHRGGGTRRAAYDGLSEKLAEVIEGGLDLLERIHEHRATDPVDDLRHPTQGRRIARVLAEGDDAVFNLEQLVE